MGKHTVVLIPRITVDRTFRSILRDKASTFIIATMRHRSVTLADIGTVTVGVVSHGLAASVTSHEGNKLTVFIRTPNISVLTGFGIFNHGHQTVLIAVANISTMLGLLGYDATVSVIAILNLAISRFIPDTVDKVILRLFITAGTIRSLNFTKYASRIVNIARIVQLAFDLS
ncbi:hypothetical protein HMPREF2527_03540 [Rothia sp. HMSC071B01]|nr:hypothetical protein HMPREF2527_03540 [Rothia sp. HMSC071B01]